MTFQLQPVSLEDANLYVQIFHRHHKKVRGHKFSLGAVKNNLWVGVCIVGRPVARAYDDGKRVEVTRLCTDGTYNACSFLYSAAARAAKALGYDVIGTYVLESETGVSLKASGWTRRHTTKGGSWDCVSRPREDKHPTEPKVYWEKVLT